MKFRFLSYFILLSLACFTACGKFGTLLKDAEQVNLDLIKIELDANDPSIK